MKAFLAPLADAKKTLSEVLKPGVEKTAFLYSDALRACQVVCAFDDIAVCTTVTGISQEQAQTLKHVFFRVQSGELQELAFRLAQALGEPVTVDGMQYDPQQTQRDYMINPPRHQRCAVMSIIRHGKMKP
jgi:hypothetical protein